MKQRFYISALFLTLLTALSSSAYDFASDGIYYEINGDNVKAVKNYNDLYSGNISIPETVRYNGKTYTVTSIGKSAFQSCSDLTSVAVGNSVISIEEYAFSYCENLTSVHLGHSVTTIGDFAFDQDYSLSSIDIPNSVTTIGQGFFYGCTALKSIVIPSSVTQIGNRAFCYCPELESIVVAPGNTKYDSRNNCNAIIETASDNLYAGCQSTVIPNNVNTIGDFAFYYRPTLTTINIPNSVTSIGEYAFCGCERLTSVDIPASVLHIGTSAFSYCPELESIIVASGNTVFDSRENCNALIETASNVLLAGCRNSFIPETITTIGGSAFSGCTGLSHITIPRSVTTIDPGAFYGCTSLSSINIPSTVTSIGNNSFQATGLSILTVENENPVYDSRNNCNALIETASNTIITGCQGTIIPNSVTAIGEYAFYDCTGLTNVIFPKVLTEIGKGAFNGCSGLTEVVIPSSVTTLGMNAFYRCTSLTDVYSHIKDLSSVTVGNSVFSLRGNDYSGRKLHVPSGTIQDYENDYNWSPFFETIVEFEPGDVNGDSETNIADINSVISVILSGTTNALSDVNCDGETNIADINAIISEILK